MSRRATPFALVALLLGQAVAAPAVAGLADAGDSTRGSWRGIVQIESVRYRTRLAWALELVRRGDGRLDTLDLRPLACVATTGARAPTAPAETAGAGLVEPASGGCRFDPLAYYHCVFERCLRGSGDCLERVEAVPACFAERCRETFDACFERAAGCPPAGSPP